MYKTCDKRTVAGYDIVLIQSGIDRFTVVYGLEVKADLTYPQAAKAYGSALMHALALEGKLEIR